MHTEPRCTGRHHLSNNRCLLPFGDHGHVFAGDGPACLALEDTPDRTLVRCWLPVRHDGDHMGWAADDRVRIWPDEPEQERPLLGLATNRELLAELSTRIEIHGPGLEYSTVSGSPQHEEPYKPVGAQEPFAFDASGDGPLDLRGAIFQALGAASTCWDQDGVFQSERAAQIGETLIEYLREHPLPSPDPRKGPCRELVTQLVEQAERAARAEDRLQDCRSAHARSLEELEELHILAKQRAQADDALRATTGNDLEQRVTAAGMLIVPAEIMDGVAVSDDIITIRVPDGWFFNSIARGVIDLRRNP